MKNQLMQQLISGIPTEIIYSFVIIMCSLMIYFGTKELYELSSHKGIKYFRKGFLFFAFAYFFRSLIKVFFLFMNPREIMHSQQFLLGPIAFLAFMYFSSMAVFYILCSVLWKRLEKKISISIFHLFASAIAIASLFITNYSFNLILNISLFVIIALTFYLANKGSKKKRNNLLVIYLLLSGFWFLNILDILIPNFLQPFQIFIYLASLTIFLLILYKVIRKTN